MPWRHRNPTPPSTPQVGIAATPIHVLERRISQHLPLSPLPFSPPPLPSLLENPHPHHLPSLASSQPNPPSILQGGIAATPIRVLERRVSRTRSFAGDDTIPFENSMVELPRPQASSMSPLQSGTMSPRVGTSGGGAGGRAASKEREKPAAAATAAVAKQLHGLPAAAAPQPQQQQQQQQQHAPQQQQQPGGLTAAQATLLRYQVCLRCAQNAVVLLWNRYRTGC